MDDTAQSDSSGFSLRRRLPLNAVDVQFYRLADVVSGFLLCAMTLFGPWAFGTTQDWSIRIMNYAGVALGALLLFKWFVRFAKGFQPLRWDDAGSVSSDPGAAEYHQRGIRFARRIRQTLAVLTLLVLAFCLISAVNARATYHRESQSFEYHECIRWLPHSMDRGLTWDWFWICLALAGSFWALHDWLLGRTSREERALRPGGGEGETHFLPERLRIFLWLLCLNGALLGLEGIVQRLEGSGRLLFRVKPVVNPEAITQFGPWAYRANAASYFNLLWPVCLGFWWTLHRAGGFKRKSHHALLLFAALMAACPVISTSRGGALISAGILVSAIVLLLVTDLFLFVAHKREAQTRRLTYAALVVFCVAAIALGYQFGWKPLKPRLAQFGEGLEGREEMYENARPMAEDYPWFGTGPGTFEPVFQLYRKNLDVYWPAQLHNDWLETRITFGRLGLGLLLAALCCVWLRWFAPGGIHGGRRFVMLCWLALAGCLVHARFDFPFQIYSILFLFVSICAVLFSVTQRA